jgi:hypothetical protein
VRWQALLVGVASNAHFWEDPDDEEALSPQDPGFVQSLNSQAEFARALERSMPGLPEDDLIVLPEPRYAHEVTDAIAGLNQAHDDDGNAGLVRPGLLFYYCGHGMNVRDRLYLSTVETIDDDASRRRTGLALSDVLATIAATRYNRPRVVLILDCCFAGLACEEPDDPATRRPHLLMAVSAKERAEHDRDSTGPTFFTSALVDLLRDGDPGAGPWIDLEAAFRWLEPELVARHGEQRRPLLRTGERGPVVLGGNPVYSGPSVNREST